MEIFRKKTYVPTVIEWLRLEQNKQKPIGILIFSTISIVTGDEDNRRKNPVKKFWNICITSETPWMFEDLMKVKLAKKKKK